VKRLAVTIIWIWGVLAAAFAVFVFFLDREIGSSDPDKPSSGS
jgi:hypothetical protein